MRDQVSRDYHLKLLSSLPKVAVKMTATIQINIVLLTSTMALASEPIFPDITTPSESYTVNPINIMMKAIQRIVLVKTYLK